MFGYLSKLKNKLNSTLCVVSLKLENPSVKIGRNFQLYGKLQTKINKDSKVILGNNIIFRSATKYNFVGINKPVSISVSKMAELFIGDNSGFSGTSIFVSSKIVIGNNCNFGGNTFIWDTDFHPLNHLARRINQASEIKNAPIIIGDDVFVGANSVILKGVTIGDRAIIGAGSVITKNIPADEIWAGNPAKFIRINTQS